MTKRIDDLEACLNVLGLEIVIRPIKDPLR